MKTLFLFTLTTLITLSLSARENPFVPTSAYEEESARLIEANENDGNISEESYIKEMQEKMMSIPTKGFERNDIKVEDANKSEVKMMEKEMPKKEVFSQKEVKTLIEKAKKQTVQETKKIIQEEIQTVKQQKPQQIVYVKPRADVKDKAKDLEMTMKVPQNTMLKKKQLADFLYMEYSDDKLILTSKYNLLKWFAITKTKKLVFDFKAKVHLLTKTRKIDSMNYKKIALGNHYKFGYFRAVVLLDKNPSNFKVMNKGKTIIITKK